MYGVRVKSQLFLAEVKAKLWPLSRSPLLNTSLAFVAPVDHIFNAIFVFILTFSEVFMPVK